MEINSLLEKKTAAALTVTCVRKLTTILAVAIAAVAIAALSVFLSATIYLLEKQTFIADYHRVGTGLPHHLEVSESKPISLSINRTSPEKEDERHLNLVFVLDFWERMVNIQSGLRRLVNIGVESGFTVVEPFVYESKTKPMYSDPSHFILQNMTPQPARRYFQTEDFFFTNSYITYDEAVKRLERVEEGGGTEAKKYVIHAAVYFDWPQTSETEEKHKESTKSSPFRWCDEKLRTMVASNFGYMLSQTTFIERAVCLFLKDTMSPSILTPQYFQSLFRFVRNGTNSASRRCDKCVALAFMNYRKHAFNGFRSNLGIQPFKQKVPPLEVSAFGKELGERVRTEILGRRPYVAIQMRTGKAFTLFEKYENSLAHAGVNVSRYSSFKSWLRGCTRKLSSAAKIQGGQLGRRVVYYIASDMFNEGWKGGEECPEEVMKALEEAKRYLSKELYPIYRFDPNMFGVRQDLMGTSSIADAAVSREADKFLFARPSNFGRWVAEQRELAGRGEVVRINCMDERLIDA